MGSNEFQCHMKLVYILNINFGYINKSGQTYYAPSLHILSAMSVCKPSNRCYDTICVSFHVKSQPLPITYPVIRMCHRMAIDDVLNEFGEFVTNMMVIILLPLHRTRY